MRRQHINVGSRISFLPLPARRVNRLHIISSAVQPARSLNLHPQQSPLRPRPNNKVILLAVAPGQRQPKSQRLCLHQKRRLRQLPHPLRIRPSAVPTIPDQRSSSAKIQGINPGTGASPAPHLRSSLYHLRPNHGRHIQSSKHLLPTIRRKPQTDKLPHY